MQRNIVIAVIIIVLFILLTLLGFLIWWIQNGFPRRGGGGSYTSDEESAHWGMIMATRDKRYKHEERMKKEGWSKALVFVKEILHEDKHDDGVFGFSFFLFQPYTNLRRERQIVQRGTARTSTRSW
jgi:hypothetical protein